MQTKLLMAIMLTAFVACSSAALNGTGTGGSTGGFSAGGRGGVGGGLSGAAGCEGGEGGCGVCPALDPNGPFTCAPGSTAIACDIPPYVRELRTSNEHVYMTIDLDLYRVDGANLQRLLRIDSFAERREIDEPYLYYTEGNNGDLSKKYPLWRRLLDGSDSPSVVWDCSGYTTNFLIDGDHIFLRALGGVLRIDKRAPGGRAIQLLPSGYNPGYDMAVDDARLYWSSPQGITASPKTSTCACACAGSAGGGAGSEVCPSVYVPPPSGIGGAGGGTGLSFPCAQPEQLATTARSTEFVTPDRDWVYFASDRDLYRVAKTGGTPEMLLDASLHVRSMAANATDIYVAVTAVQTLELQLLRIPRGGREATVLVREPIPPAPDGRIDGVTGMVATRDAVYWASQSLCAATLFRYQIAGTSTDSGN
jgi:hypothetical protein